MPNHIYFEPDKLVSFENTKLNPKLERTLRKKMAITALFEMQDVLLSHMLYGDVHGTTDDIVLCAPTGSGKTLAYALPIVQGLMHRTIPRLRAVIVVPTRDLAVQVYEVFRILAKSVSLSVAIITGSASVAREAHSLGGCEILVATPGRLVHHVRHTEAVSLMHVHYLVLDESDRLLQESYDQWLSVLMPRIGEAPLVGREDEDSIFRPTTGLLALAIVPTVASKAGSDFGIGSDVRVRKILVSATQSQNPTYMIHLDMRCPTMFYVKPRHSATLGHVDDEANRTNPHYFVPSTLEETGYILKRIQQKPAALLSVLGWTAQNPDTASTAEHMSTGAKIIFTNSIESAHRLCRLLELCAYVLGYKTPILEMSGELSAERRREVVEFIKTPSQQGSSAAMDPIIVSSDLLSRGMDMFSVDRVINYDAPVHIRTYLHRAGRTARAGRPGNVVTLLLAKQVHHFRTMVHEADRGDKTVKTFNLSSADYFSTDVKNLLSCSLIALQRVLQREKIDLLLRQQPLPQYALFELCNHTGHPSGSDDSNKTMYIQSDEALDHDLHGKLQNTRRRTTNANEHVDSSIIDQEITLEERKDVEQAGDNLRDLLYAQIAKNIML